MHLFEQYKLHTLIFLGGITRRQPVVMLGTEGVPMREQANRIEAPLLL